MAVRKLTSEQRLSRSIDIMEALYAAGEAGMTRDEICSRFDISGASLDEIIGIINAVKGEFKQLPLIGQFQILK